MRAKRGAGTIVLECVLVLVALLFLYPIVLIFINSLKPISEIMGSFFSLPRRFALENYSTAWKVINYPKLFLNNLIITTIGTAGIIAVSSLAAYKLSRTRGKYSWALFIFCVMPMIVPFQTTMITLLKLAKTLHLSDSIFGLAVQYWGFGAPFAIFLYHGFVKTIPKELDESAIIDGAGPFTAFTQIIFPLLKSVTSTIIVVDVMWIWNDFLLPLIMVNSSKSTRTLTLAVYSFFGQYNTSWQYAIAALVLTIIPAIVYFLAMQKYIVKGVTAGAVKA
jgi:raffinose/stachyose/melibiose transport system permease protein